MAVIYSPEAKAARMDAVCDLMAGGALELLGTAGVLARIALPPEYCACDGDTISCKPQEGTFAAAKGRAASARIVDAGGNPVITGLTVGQKNADVILDYPDLVTGQIVTIEAMTFKHA